MRCQKCKSNRILSISCKHSDCWDGEFKGKEHSGYAPSIEGVCDGDDTSPDICLECGQVQGKFPVKDPVFDSEEDEENEERLIANGIAEHNSTL